MWGRGWLYAVVLAAASWTVDAQEYRQRLPQDEVIYFLLPDRFANGDPANDRGGLRGGPLQTGFDPAAKGFFHGGDLRGVLGQLDYIQQLGATAIWLAPIFKNKPVQGAPGHESAGYHGYWITDFTRVDPHFGTEEDFRALVDAAHGRGMKIYMDIVVNHTADVIFYRECTPQMCPYRSRVERPYTPYVPKGEEHIKFPDWLNDLSNYHNRGNSTFEGESALDGDFAGLDDLMTENPRVVQGFIDIYGAWIDRYGVDGFRIDTARHVNSEFLQTFVPAMLARARARGITNFHIFGEVYTGAVDVASGRVEHAVNLGLSGLDLGSEVAARLGRSVRVENDVNAAALGAFSLLGRTSSQSMAYLNLGTSLAAGLVLGGRLWRGSRGVAGEIGHIPVDPAGDRCGCGQRGCPRHGPIAALAPEQQGDEAQQCGAHHGLAFADGMSLVAVRVGEPALRGSARA